MKNKFKQTIAICLGVGFGLLYGKLFSSLLWSNKQELQLYDRLMQWRSFTIAPSDDILLINIDKETFLRPEIEDRQSFYARVANWFLEQKAGVVVLNFPYEWANQRTYIFKKNRINSKTNPANNSLQNLIEKNSENIVLIGSTHGILNRHHNWIPNYSHFIPLDKNLEQLKDPARFLKYLSKLQGFFEYENIEGKKPSNLSSPARRAYAKGTFQINAQLKNFQSFAWLTLEKYQKLLQKPERNLSDLPDRIQINYWQPQKTFPTLNLKDLCTRERENPCKITSTPELQKKIQDKIVIIGFSEGDELDVLAMKSPFGEMIPGIEVQANLLSSLMTNSYYQTILEPVVILIHLLGGAIIGGVMASCKTRQCLIYLGLGMVGGYSILSVVAFNSGWMLPIVSPILTWIATAISIAIYFINIQLVRENERKQIQIAEEEAVISQAKKLILRIWSDIHDDPLQELKVAMDDLELLPIPDTDSEPILNRLSYVGTEIRKYLDVNPTDELTLQPELRQGLVAAIEQHLQQLTDSGTLQLKVVTNLQSIEEPLLSSKWIDAREDIFRFFREAMTNVVRHAQGENSTSTQVIVSLSQEAEQCTLIIENDGGVVDTASKSRRKGGMGTKLMAEMAASLPDGVWESVALPDGGMRVKLLWTQRF